MEFENIRSYIMQMTFTEHCNKFIVKSSTVKVALRIIYPYMGYGEVLETGNLRKTKGQ